MPRTLTSAMAAALAASASQPSLFVELTFLSETVRVWSGLGTVTWGGHDWLGLGSLLGFTVSEDAATVEARGIAITVSGLDPALLASALADYQLGLPAVVSLGFWSGGSLVDHPAVVWSGQTDQPTAEVAPEAVTITIACESRLTEMNVAAERRYTNEDQQMDWPGDLGLQFVDALQEAALFWGQNATVTTNV